MTGWDVASDAVKIGLPLLLGIAGTLFTLRVSRRHGERIERRKRIHETLEGLTRAVCRWHDANKDHYLFRRDQYFKKREPVLPWLEGNLDTLKRCQQYMADVLEFESVLLVHIGLEFYLVKIGELVGAHNAVTRALAEPGKTEAEIAAFESKTDAVYRDVIERIRAVHRTV